MSLRRPAGRPVADYDYELPPDRVARYPAPSRDESRLLVVPPAGAFRHLRLNVKVRKNSLDGGVCVCEHDAELGQAL